MPLANHFWDEEFTLTDLEASTSQALYRKWRPHLWEQVVGQEHIVHTLKNAIRTNRVGHAYLFAGPRGTGKTTSARLLAKAVNCLAESLADRPCDQCEHCRSVNEGRFLDLIEIDAASNTSVDDVRDLRDKINFAPSQGRYKVYIIDEVHMLSTAAFNALLKTLEEPPAHAIFILATTEVHKIPATVLSRCQRHEFRRIPVNAIVAYLREMIGREHLQVDDEALTLVARQSTGCMRDAISLLDQLTSTGERVSLEMAQTVLGTATSQVVVGLVGAILAGDTAAGLNHVHRALDSGSDPRQFTRQVVDYLRNLLLIRMGNGEQVDATPEARAQLAQHAQAFDLAHLLGTVRLFNQAAGDASSGWQPGLPLELALVEAVQLKDAPVQLVAAAPAAAQPVRQAASVPAPAAAPEPALSPAPSGGAPAAPAAGEQQIALQTVQQNWNKVRALTKKYRPQTDALLNSCRLMALKDGVLTIGFISDVVKSKMEAGDNIDLTRQAIQHLLGVNLQILCVVTNARTGGTPLELEVDSEGMVGTALNLGGEIVQKE